MIAHYKYLTRDSNPTMCLTCLCLDTPCTDCQELASPRVSSHLFNRQVFPARCWSPVRKLAHAHLMAGSPSGQILSYNSAALHPGNHARLSSAPTTRERSRSSRKSTIHREDPKVQRNKERQIGCTHACYGSGRLDTHTL